MTLDKKPQDLRAQNKLDSVNQETANELRVEHRVINKEDLPARLFTYSGGITGDYSGGLRNSTKRSGQRG